MKPLFRFLPASPDENTVYGAERPGYGSNPVEAAAVSEWLEHMRANGVRRVCCLLTAEQLDCYTQDLLGEYNRVFGENNVCWAPVEDYHLCDPETLRESILPFLFESDKLQNRVVVHCAGGLGRTGHVLAAWLAAGRGFPPQPALEKVTAMQRLPREAVESGNATESELLALLEAASAAFDQSHRA